MKALSISTNNEKKWQLLLSFLEKHKLDFQIQGNLEKETQNTNQNYIWYLCQNPLSLDDIKPLSREEIYE